MKYLETYQYASRDHVIWLLYCPTGRRPGAIRSLDVSDVHLGEDLYLALWHRPDQGTRLKNGTRGEGDITIRDAVVRVLADYIEQHWDPLLTS